MYHRTKRLSIGLLLAAFLPSTHAATYLVGSGAGCQFTTIQAAINAAQSNPGEDIVRISNNQTYSTAVSIGQQDLTLDGRYLDCQASAPNGNYAQLVGASGNRPAMVTITGSGVRVLSGIQIRDNARTQVGANGGAIEYSGTGELVTTQVEIVNNSATNGGAISATDSGGEAVVSLLTDTTINGNFATASGGGIVLRGDSRLIAVNDRTLITNNGAGQLGGGIHISDASAIAYVASPGLGSTPVLSGNIAQDGGAVSVNDGVLQLYTTVANRPTTMQSNRARAKGGAVYIATGTGLACMRDFYINGNRAAEGSAVYNEGDTTGLNPQLSLCNLGSPPAPAIQCTRNQNGCNLIENHVTETAAGVRTAGAAILQNNGGSFNYLDMTGTTLGNNFGAHVIRTVDATSVRMTNILIASNGASTDPLTGSLLRLNWESANNNEFIMRNVTIARNFSNATQVVQMEDGPNTLAFNHNLIWQPGKTTLTLPFAIANSANYNWDFNSGHDVGILPPPWNSSVANPRFVFFEGNNFRLRVGSPLVDLYPVIAPNAPFSTQDLDGRPRPVDFPLRDSRLADVGAFETQVTDEFILNGGFFGSLLFWQTEAPAGSVSFSSTDSGTVPGSGSATVAIPSAQISTGVTRINALNYCFNVPGPGSYTVGARAFRNSGIFADAPVLRWRVRNNADVCQGAATSEADAFFAAGTGWQNLATPLVIPITTAQYTINTTIEIRLDYAEGNPVLATSNGLSGGFDNIFMVGQPPLTDDIFKNGFE
jgi:predicted outer membrane repeat protein